MKFNWKAWRENFDLADLDARHYGFLLASVLVSYNAFRFLFLLIAWASRGDLDDAAAAAAAHVPTASLASEKIGLGAARTDHRCYQLYQNLSRLHASIGTKHPPSRLSSRDIFDENDDIYLRSMWVVEQDYEQIREHGNKTVSVKDAQIQDIKQKILYKKPYNQYEDVYLESMLKKHLDAFEVQSTKTAVLGLYKKEWVPWIESLLLYFGANDITTIDYTRKSYESPNIKWIHLAQYLSDKVNEHSIYKMISSFLHSADNFDGEYDVVVSHLAIESIGLGRFGEDLYPDADLHSIEQVYCMLKKGGRFFLSVSASRDNSSYIEYNTRRVYGENRLKSALSQWTVEEVVTYNFEAEKLFVLRKP